MFEKRTVGGKLLETGRAYKVFGRSGCHRSRLRLLHHSAGHVSQAGS